MAEARTMRAFDRSVLVSRSAVGARKRRGAEILAVLHAGRRQGRTGFAGPGRRGSCGRRPMVRRHIRIGNSYVRHNKTVLDAYYLRLLPFDSSGAQWGAPAGKEDGTMRHRTGQGARARCAALAVAMLAAGVLAIALVSPSAQAAEATEGEKMAFTVKIGTPPTGMSVRYKYKTADGSAVKDEDYEAATGTVTFPAGDTEETVSVETLDDSDVEDTEDFKLELYDRQFQAAYLGTSAWVELQQNFEGIPTTMTLTGEIEDND